MPQARNRSRSAAATRTNHELDEVVLDQSKTKMKGSAAPLLAEINQLVKSAKKNIKKRQTFVDGAEDLKQEVRDAYDEGDEGALKTVAKSVTAYKNSLLRPSRRSTSR